MTDTDLLTYLTEPQVVALTIWAEARNQPIQGQIAVACVIRNRAKARRQTMRDVCLAPWQFSCWNEGNDYNHLKLMEMARTFPHPTDVNLKQALWITEGLASGAVLSPVGSADHYLTIELFETSPPSWAETMPVVARIGAHLFLKGP